MKRQVDRAKSHLDREVRAGGKMTAAAEMTPWSGASSYSPCYEASRAPYDYFVLEE